MFYMEFISKVKKSQIPCIANHAAGSIYMGIEKRSFIEKLLYNNKKNSIVKYYPWQTRNVHDADNKTLLEELFPGK